MKSKVGKLSYTFVYTCEVSKSANWRLATPKVEGEIRTGVTAARTACSARTRERVRNRQRLAPTTCAGANTRAGELATAIGTRENAN